MGVPAFFRWLSKKYPSIVVECDANETGGDRHDARRDTQWDYHFDNLYLDMNGIIHPCSHPEHKAPPENEQQMFSAIFEYIERIMKIVRPNKLLYMAVDGVAPRAKMNQQRSRRFRASQESYEKGVQIDAIKRELREKGVQIEDKPKEAHFDSNVITPGTQFMVNLSEALRSWIDLKLSADNVDEHGIWPKHLMVILSDASVPGEGEHKIIDYIRKQKAMADTFDPNLSHCLYGADADLIMLGLATHELNFTILREEFIPNQPKPCDICGQLGHDMTECMGTERVEDDMPLMPTEPGFIYIRLNVLREYLQRECTSSGIYLDLERFIDDFVFLCFFVGNDFLPHLPSLEIRENAIDRLLYIYKDVMAKHKESEFYLTHNGIVNLSRVQLILQSLGEVEDEIFKSRQQNEIRFKERRKKQKLMEANFDSKWMRPQAVVAGQRPNQLDNIRNEAFKLRHYAANVDNLSAAQKLKSMLKTGEICKTNDSSDNRSVDKRKRDDSDEEPEDLVQLWNDGWKERYYLHKFDSTGISDISQSVAREYIIGLCWVLLYYYQGCPDWKWFYPYHYAPFASDFKDIAGVKVEFDHKAKPFRPLEQLMSVFPAASSTNLPPTWRQLMSDLNSSIIDFYPNTFKIDLNGKRAAWMGVALLPFIDEQRLFNALTRVYSDLTEDEEKRNARGKHLIFVSRCDSNFSQFAKEIVDNSKTSKVLINPELFQGISGTLSKSKFFTDAYKKVYCVKFKDPTFDKNFIFPARRLPNAKSPPSVLKPDDIEKLDRYSWRPMIGMNYSKQRAYVNDCGMRMLSNSIPKQYNQYNNHNTQSNYGNANSRPQQRYQPYYGPQTNNTQSRPSAGGSGYQSYNSNYNDYKSNDWQNSQKNDYYSRQQSFQSQSQYGNTYQSQQRYDNQSQRRHTNPSQSSYQIQSQQNYYSRPEQGFSQQLHRFQGPHRNQNQYESRSNQPNYNRNSRGNF